MLLSNNKLKEKVPVIMVHATVMPQLPPFADLHIIGKKDNISHLLSCQIVLYQHLNRYFKT